MGRLLDSGSPLTVASSSGSTVSISDNGIQRDIFGIGGYQIFGMSGTFKVPDGVSKIRVRVLGAGGSGASKNGSADRASGGGGGGFAMGVYDVTPGDTFAVTVGQGGVTPSGSVNGVSGGSSSFGALLSATGGAGGVYAEQGTYCAGAAGGVGSGGNIINATGGVSGYIEAGVGSSSATGGGSAASQYGDGCASGAIVGANGNTYKIATGGASPRSPSATVNCAPLFNDFAGGGAGSAGIAGQSLGGYDIYSRTATAASAAEISNIIIRFPGEIFIGGGGAGVESATGFDGVMGGGGGAVANVTGQRAGAGGYFAGGGGCACNNSGGGGFGGIGGGGGGVAGVNGGITTPSRGGDGLVIMEW